MRLGLALLLAAGVAVRLAYAHRGLVIFDEFQHLHPAWLITLGQTPYVDFFAHHPPLYYYLAAALLPLDAPSFDTIIHARYLALAVHGVTIGLIALWVARIAGRAEALVVAALLVANFFFFAFGTRAYLDTYALPLVVCSAWLLSTGRRPLSCALAGAAFGLAVLFTPKAVFAALCHAAILLGRRAGWRTWWAEVLAYGAGGLATLALLPALLGIDGTIGFVRDTIVFNVGYKGEYFPRRELLMLAGSEGFLYLAAVVGTLGVLARVVRRRFVVEAADVPALMLVAMAAGIVLLPVAFEEYFIEIVPFAVVVAGMTLVAWWRVVLAPSAPKAHPWRTVILVVAAAAWLVDVVGQRLHPTNPITLAAVAAMVGVTALVALLLALQRGAPAALWLALLIVPPLVQQIDWISRRPNGAQRARVDYIMRTTGPNDAVFDGHMGYGVFRPHAYRYWFLQWDFQPMLTTRERGADVVAALETTRAPIAIVDDNTRLLEPEVLSYLAEHYEDTEFPEVKRRRVGGADH